MSSHTPEETLDLKEAASFLKMHPQSLREKTIQGKIPGAKIGKHWIFIKEDLVKYIRSQYANQRSRSQVQHKGDSLCYTSVPTQSSTGVVSPHQMDKEYKNLLKP